jgi:Protein of unknown function (DUF4065)
MTEIKTWTENVGRFKELILYISQKSIADPKFNNLKLNKLMFFADFWAYGLFGEPITGFAYIKLEKGPAPKRMHEIRKEMVEEEKSLALQTLPLEPWHRTVNLRSPNLAVFKPEHVSLIDSVIEALNDVGGEEASAISHKLPCWMVPSLGETIPYEMVFLSHEAPTDADKERGRAVALELNLLEQTA